MVGSFVSDGFFIFFFCRRPSGSELKVASVGLANEASRNPDHIGGYSVATPIFAGLETKFGICLPRFQRPVT